MLYSCGFSFVFADSGASSSDGRRADDGCVTALMLRGKGSCCRSSSSSSRRSFGVCVRVYVWACGRVCVYVCVYFCACVYARRTWPTVLPTPARGALLLYYPFTSVPTCKRLINILFEPYDIIC